MANKTKTKTKRYVTREKFVTKSSSKPVKVKRKKNKPKNYNMFD